MARADFAGVLQDLDALESELEPIRLAVDEGEGMLRSPTARETVYRHLEAAVRHTLESARGLIEEADWDEPEDDVDAIGILVEEDVLPRRLADTLMELAEFATEEGGKEPWGEDGLYHRMSQGADAFSEYLEYVHLFLKEWSE